MMVRDTPLRVRRPDLKFNDRNGQVMFLSCVWCIAENEHESRFPTENVFKDLVTSFSLSSIFIVTAKDRQFLSARSANVSWCRRDQCGPVSAS